MAEKVYIGLGSNLGDRRRNLDEALARLRGRGRIKVGAVSTYHETAPVDCPPGASRFLNAAAELTTDLPPGELLRELQAVEAEAGRTREAHNAPRTLDLDLLLYGQRIVDDAGPPPLKVPHPRLPERAFVLEPLAEIAPAAVHPVSGLSVRALLERLNPMRGLLAGQRALVTGSTSGIGRAIALGLARAGARVIVHGRRFAERAGEVAAQCALHASSAVQMCDLRQADERERLANKAWEVWDGLDIVVNNAGADTLTADAASWDFERKLRELWAVDVEATIDLSRRLGERMQASGGVILTMGWDRADLGMEGDSGQLFATVKGAVMAYTRSLARSLAPRVRVNCLAPGWIKTAWGEGASAAWQERAVRETPMARWGTPEDVAHAAVWLASPAAAFMSGQIVRVNGGAV